MTNEETLKYLKSCVGDGSMEFVYQPIKTEVLENAIKALEKVEKYKWHDLCKDPKDIPNDKRQVYVACEWSEYNTDFYPFADGVLAWSEIEPFEVGE